MSNSDHVIFVEKYRPDTISKCILPKDLVKTFEDIVSSGEIQNMLFCGPPGCGKTTVAKALCMMLGVDFLFINASEESGIDTLRNKVRNFASSVSLTEKGKVVILDEADYLNPQSTQPALRGFIEEFAVNCRFILTCNFKNRIISPLHSRCSVIDFAFPKSERPELAMKFMESCINILDGEGIVFDTKVLAELIKKHFPDFRRVINELQRYGVGGKIDSGILSNISEVTLNNLVKSLKDKDFTQMRKWVGENSDMDCTRLYRKLYDNMYNYLERESIPQLVLLLADYQYKNAFVADAEINTVALLTEIMCNCKFK